MVVAKGALVDDETLRLGDDVGIKWLNSSCFECSFYISGDESLCQRATHPDALWIGQFSSMPWRTQSMLPTCRWEWKWRSWRRFSVLG